MELFIDILKDTTIDTVKLIPFLFLTYLAMEYLENKGMKQVICVPPVRQENPNNTTENLTMDQVKAIYTGEAKVWSDITK